MGNENPSDGAMLPENSQLIGSYTTPTLIPDDELSCNIRSHNYEQRKLFDIVQGFHKQWWNHCMSS